MTKDNQEQVIRHIALIMDGNGRWAKKRFLPRVKGHAEGAKALRRIVEASRELGIRYITVYAFSTENWNRPQDEVSSLMNLFISSLEKETPLLKKNNIRLRAMGALSMLPQNVQDKLNEAMESTKSCDAMDLIIAVSYGGRREICDGIKKLCLDYSEKKFELSDITEKFFQNYLYLPDVPDPDFMIRTSGEVRISNFLLWQLAYSELVISQKFWPEFDKEELVKCIEEFKKRDRRFGKVK